MRAARGPRRRAAGGLAETLVEAGRLTTALEVVDEAGDAAHDARMAVAAAGVERLLGRHDAARRRLERALDTTAPGSRERARVLADLAAAAYLRGQYAEMREWTQQIERGQRRRRCASRVRDAARGRRSVRGPTDAAGPPAADALAVVEDAGDDELAASAELAGSVSWGLLALERLPEALAVARRVSAAARRAGNGLAAIPHDLAAINALGLLGRVAEAEPLADETEQAARVSGNAQLVQWALWMNAWVLADRGRLDAALAAAQESVTMAGELDPSASADVARAVLGAVLGARGEHQRGRALLASYEIDHGWICRWAPVLVESDLAAGDLTAAARHADRAAALAPGTGMAGARAAAGRAQALVALAEGDAARAAALALTAASPEAAGAALEAARDRLVAGRALLETDRDAAIALLTDAAEQAAQCGAPRVEDEAHRALRGAGVRLGRGGARAPGTEGLDSSARASARSPRSWPTD